MHAPHPARPVIALYRATVTLLLGVGGGVTASCALLNVAGHTVAPGPIGAGVLMLASGGALLLAQALTRHTATLIALRAEIAAALAGGEASARAVRRILDEGRAEA